MIPALEFNELDDFVAHLRDEEQTDWVHFDVGHTVGDRDSNGIRAISFYAIATRRFLAPAEYLVVWACPILNTTSVHLQMDKHEPPEKQSRTFIHTNMDKVRAQLEAHGLKVRPGKWLSQPPEYLR
jgi:hypothetical protein